MNNEKSKSWSETLFKLPCFSLFYTLWRGTEMLLIYAAEN